MNNKFPSELRLDPVSKDWVVIATGRARKPESFKKNHRLSLDTSKTRCPFETLDKQEHATLAFFKGERMPIVRNQELKEWTTVSLPNKYPAFTRAAKLSSRFVGPYKVMAGVGSHEVIVTKDHRKDIPEFTLPEVRELIEVYHERFLDLMRKEFVRYVAIFKNKGAEAGASVAHPHSQIIAIPIIDPDLENSLQGSKEYFDEYRKCVHCSMLNWDRKDKKRIIFENESFVVLCPFASQVSFEIRIYPKEHSGYFEKITDDEKDMLAEALRVVMRKLSKALKDPDYNYFIHTAPVDGKDYDHYHWHLEILPKTSTWAGFELGTGIEISTIEPEKAAAFLRKQRA